VAGDQVQGWAASSNSTEGAGPDGLTLLQVLGSGASGVVLLGERADGGRVAVKRLAGDWDDPGALARFRRESRILALLDHPHIVRSDGQVTGAGEAWLVMEYVDGPTLEALLQEFPMSTADALAVLEGVSGALAYAHAQGVLHRDLTPANVLFDSSGRPLLADFGVATLLGSKHHASLMTFRTQTGALVGTPSYMSPEAAEGTGDLTVGSDVYSLGVLAYRLLVGRTPFPATGDVLEMLRAQIHEPAPAPSTFGVQLPPAVEAALLHALEKDLARRPSSAAAFWEELVAGADGAWPAWRERAGLEARVRDLPGDNGAGTPAVPGAHEDGTVDIAGILRAPLVTNRVQGPVFTPKRRRSWPGVVAAGVAAAVVVVVIALVFPPSTQAITVVSLSLASDPSAVSDVACPARFVVTGTILTNGAGGSVQYRWSGTGDPGDQVRSASVASGQRLVTTSLTVSVAVATDSPARLDLRVLSPSPSATGPVSIELHCVG